MRVIDHDAFANARGWVDIHAKNLGNAHLYKIRQVFTALFPKPIGNAVGLNRLKPLEEHNGLQQAMARRIALINGHQIRARRLNNCTIVRKGFIREITQNNLAHFI